MHFHLVRVIWNLAVVRLVRCHEVLSVDYMPRLDDVCAGVDHRGDRCGGRNAGLVGLPGRSLLFRLGGQPADAATVVKVSINVAAIFSLNG